MNKVLCKGGMQRDQWAISLCFSSALIMTIEAVHGKPCAWLGLDVDETYLLSTGIATLSLFLGTFILTRLLVNAEAED